MFPFIESFLQQMFASPCVHCKVEIATNVSGVGSLGLCANCAGEVSFSLRAIGNSNLVSSVWAMDSYQGALGSVVKQGKYKRRATVFRKIGRTMAGACLDLPPFDIVSFVPLSWHRKMDRGFDQAEVLAEEIAQFLGVPHMALLERTDYSRQADKSMQERKKQLTGRFSLHKNALREGMVETPGTKVDNTPYVIRDPKLRSHIRNKTILLVDDVFTTGSTLDGCGIELYDAGVEKVLGCTVVSSKLGG